MPANFIILTLSQELLLINREIVFTTLLLFLSCKMMEPDHLTHKNTSRSTDDFIELEQITQQLSQAAHYPSVPHPKLILHILKVHGFHCKDLKKSVLYIMLQNV